MDQNYQAGEGIFFEPPVKKNASYYRALARERLKGNFWMPTLITLIAQGIPSMIYSLLASPVIVVMYLPIYFPDLEIPTGVSIGATLAILLISLIVYTLIGSPLLVGLYRAFLQVVDGEKPTPAVLFSRFRESYGKVARTYLLYFAATLLSTVPLFLCVVPLTVQSLHPLIAISLALILYAVGAFLLMRTALTYTFVFAIRAEYPEIGALDAMRNARMLMKGNRWKLFWLTMSFMGWIFLLILATVVTCGIGALGFYPLMTYIQTAFLLFYHDISQRGAAKETEFPSLNPEDYDPNQAQW